MNIAKIDELFCNWFSTEKPPALSYVVLLADGQLHEVSLGSREHGQEHSINPQTRFRIASMTKSFVAASILALRSEGKLELSDTIDVLVPDLKLDPALSKATVHQLLSMQSGLPVDDP